MRTPTNRLLYALPEVLEQLSIGRSTLYELIAAGELKAVKIGRRTLISHTELERFVKSRVEAIRPD